MLKYWGRFALLLRIVLVFMVVGASTAEAAGAGSASPFTGAAALYGASPTGGQAAVLPNGTAVPPGMVLPPGVSLPQGVAPPTPGTTKPAAPGKDGGTDNSKDSRDTTQRKDALVEFPPLVPNAFQTYIFQSTGQFLPIYGSALFNQSNPFAALSSVPVPSNYIVGPGDEILLRVYSAAIDFDQTLVVGRDGTIPLPKIGPVMVAGKHMSDLEPYLKGQLSRIIADFNLSVTLGKLRGIEVYVVGQARAPGKYIVSSVSTLINALFATGGPNSNGSLRNIQLVRSGQVVGTLDLYGFLSTGDTSHDLHLEQGDAINIQRIGQQVALMGSTPTPAVYELMPTSKPQPLNDIIQLSGGVPAWTTPLKASMERIDPQQDKPLFAKALVLDAKGLATPVRDGDIVTLFPIKPAYDNAVTLHIADASPVRVPIEPGAHIRDIIPNRAALLTSGYFMRRFNMSATGANAGSELERIGRNDQDQINWGEAIIERVTDTDQQHQILSFNLEQAVVKGDPTQNLALMPGDIITIFSQKDVQVPLDSQIRMVRLQGEVNAPGIYQLQPGETLRQLVARAGGVTSRAYIYGTEVSRLSVKEQQVKNLDTIIRQMELQLNGNLNTVNLSSDLASSAQTVIERRSREQFQQKIAALRTIKPNGRVVMELDPYAHTLPDFMLENGDEIKIPYMPGSVLAVGAVYNENSLIYRPKRTVADYLKVAGINPQAEVDKTFVVHADGSIATTGQDHWFMADNVQALRLMPGDTIVVPEKYSTESGYSVFMRGLIDWSTAMGQIGLAAVAIKVLHP